jgi:hypothetical protein
MDQPMDAVIAGTSSTGPAQLPEPRVAVIERNANRDALDDFSEIAGGVFRRDHAEDRSGPPLGQMPRGPGVRRSDTAA